MPGTKPTKPKPMVHVSGFVRACTSRPGKAAVWAAAFLLLVLVLLAVIMARDYLRRKRPCIVCFGDSLTSCGGSGGRYSDFLAKALPEALVVNKGISGHTLADGRERFQRDVLDQKPRVLVIGLGANDWKQGVRPIESLRDDLASMVGAARAAGSEVVIAGVFGDHPDWRGRELRARHVGSPEFARQILEMEREIARTYGCSHVENMQRELNTPECWDSSGHPSPEGNRLVAQVLLPSVREAFLHARHKTQARTPGQESGARPDCNPGFAGNQED